MSTSSHAGIPLAWVGSLLFCIACSSASGAKSHADAGTNAMGTGGRSGGSASAKPDAALPVNNPSDSGSGSPPINAADATVVMTPGAGSDAAVTIDAGAAANDCSVCNAYATPMQTGTLELTDLNALSGLATSREQPEIVFTHNDHDRAVVYALDLQGHTRASISLENAMASDIEDIAVGPCDSATCVYLGDIGDNTAVRGEYAVLRFVEPKVPSTAGTVEMTTAFERFRFRYQDGSHNAEGLMVAPDGTIYLVTKLAPGTGGKVMATGPSSIYRLPLPLSITEVAVATKVATLPIPASDDFAASAAAAHPCGRGFLLRTYDRVYEFRTPRGAAFEAAFSATPQVIAMPDEPQSEGIDYRADGRGFVSSGEGTQAPLFLTGCE